MIPLATILPAPDPTPLPAPGWLLWSLLVLTLLLHLVAMNVLLGGSIVAATAAGRGSRSGDADLVRFTGFAARTLPVAVAATVTLGVAPLLFLQVLYGRLFFTSSILMGWSWFAVVPLLIVAYYGTYLVAFRHERLGAWGPAVRWGTVVLLLAIGFVYANDMSLMLRGDAFATLYAADGRGLHLNLGDPTLVPRWIHVMLGALAVGGLAVSAYGLAVGRSDATHGRWAMRHGAAWFASATGVNLVVGAWLLISLPEATLLRFTGRSLPATLMLAAGFGFAIAALVAAFLASQAPSPAPAVKASIAAVLATLVAMVLVRDQVRRAALETIGFGSADWVVPQWGNVALFVALLLAAVAAVVWMVAIYVRAGRRGAAA